MVQQLHRAVERDVRALQTGGATANPQPAAATQNRAGNAIHDQSADEGRVVVADIDAHPWSGRVDRHGAGSLQAAIEEQTTLIVARGGSYIDGGVAIVGNGSRQHIKGRTGADIRVVEDRTVVQGDLETSPLAHGGSAVQGEDPRSIDRRDGGHPRAVEQVQGAGVDFGGAAVGYIRTAQPLRAAAVFR